jgi:hypothetical protein
MSTELLLVPAQALNPIAIVRIMLQTWTTRAGNQLPMTRAPAVKALPLTR